MIEIITTKGSREMSGNYRTAGEVHDLIRDIEGVAKADGKLLLVVCRRTSTNLTFLDVLLNALRVPLVLITSDRGVLYPSNVLNRRASALCVNA